jgi:hypothetical protein
MFFELKAPGGRAIGGALLAAREARALPGKPAALLN